METLNASGKTTGISTRRIIAYTVDVGLLSCALWVPQLAIQLLKGVTPASVFNMSTGLNAYVWVGLTISLPSWLYFAASDRSALGATLGKRLFGLRVANKTGGRLGIVRAMLRTLIKVVPWELTHVIFFLPFFTSGQNPLFYLTHPNST